MKRNKVYNQVLKQNFDDGMSLFAPAIYVYF